MQQKYASYILKTYEQKLITFILLIGVVKFTFWAENTVEA